MNPSHTPDEESEKMRIYKSRGEIRQSSIDKKNKIYVRGRMYPGLSISRSLGDLLGHHIGVTSEPNVRILELTSADLYILIGSEGIWSHLTYKEVGDIVTEFVKKDPGISCELLWQKIQEVCKLQGL